MPKKSAILIVFSVILTGSLTFSQVEDTRVIFDKNSPGIFSLTAIGADKAETAKGTAFSIADEIIATSYHLISSASDVEVTNHKGKKVRVDGVLAFDKSWNVALLKIRGKNPVLTLGVSDALEKGNKIIALGANESGDIVSSEGTVRDFFEPLPSGKVADISLAVPETFSGGPILDTGGLVVGMAVVFERGLRFMVPVNLWKNLPRQARITGFKDWKTEDYLSTYKGASLAGVVAFFQDDMGNAQKYLERAAKLDPSQIDNHLRLAQVYFNQRNYQAAVDSFKKVIELDANRVEAYYGIGSVYLRMQRHDEAASFLKKAADLGYRDKDIFYNLGSVYEEMKDFARAAEYYEKFIQSGPESRWTAALRLGLCRMELGEFDKAIDAYLEALKEQPQDIKVNYSLTQAYQKAGLYEKAEEVYENLSRFNPDEAHTYYNMVVQMYDGAGIHEKAIDAAKRVIELNPKSEVAVYNLGIMHFKLERYNEAIETFKRALAIRPDYEFAHYNIGYSYSRLKKYKESIEAFKKFVELSPDSSDGWFNIGIGYMLLKDFENAVEPLRKCIELRPDYAEALYNLAIVYLNLGDHYSARDIHGELVKINSDLAQRLKKLLQ